MAHVPGHECDASTERKSLHAKILDIDGSQWFVGSFNWDPRSAGLNTEIGVLIESVELAANFVESMSAALPDTAWQGRLNDKAEVEWQL